MKFLERREFFNFVNTNFGSIKIDSPSVDHGSMASLKADPNTLLPNDSNHVLKERSLSREREKETESISNDSKEKQRRMQRHAHSHQGRKERFSGQRYVIKILSVFLRFSRGDSASIGVALLCPNLDSRRRPTMLTPTTKGAKIRHGNSYVIFSLAIFAFVTYICRKKLRVSRIIVPRKFRNI